MNEYIITLKLSSRLCFGYDCHFSSKRKHISWDDALVEDKIEICKDLITSEFFIALEFKNMCRNSQNIPNALKT